MSFSFYQVGRTSTAGPDSTEGVVRQVDVSSTNRNAKSSRMDDWNWGQNFTVNLRKVLLGAIQITRDILEGEDQQFVTWTVNSFCALLYISELKA